MQEYTGHSFRRTSATILAGSGANITEIKRLGGWKSTKVAEGYIEESTNYKRKLSNKIQTAITSTVTSGAYEHEKKTLEKKMETSSEIKISPQKQVINSSMILNKNDENHTSKITLKQ